MADFIRKLLETPSQTPESLAFADLMGEVEGNALPCDIAKIGSRYMGQLPPLTAGGKGGFFEVTRWIDAQKHEPQRMLVLPLAPSYRMQAGQEETAAGVPSAAAQAQDQQLQHEETHLQSITGQPGLALHRVGIGPQSYLLVMPTTLQADLALDEAATRIQTTLDTRNEHQL